MRSDGLLGAPPVAALAARVWTRGLRILAYHEVDDPPAFERQLGWLQERWQPVRAADVVAWLAGDQPLPERAVWVTFDDGDQSVLDAGLLLLDRHGIEATWFVCPGLVEERAPYWWDVVDRAAARQGPSEGERRSTALKRVPDADRRAAVAVATAELAEAGDLPEARHVDEDGLRRWTAAGHQLGNHSWDHPCLDQCDPEAVRWQVATAADWLRWRFPDQLPLFAYPNGNWSQAAEDALSELGMAAGLLFDHRVCTDRTQPLRTSRLRLDADASLPRTRAIVSGLHPYLFHQGRGAGGRR